MRPGTLLRHGETGPSVEEKYFEHRFDYASYRKAHVQDCVDAFIQAARRTVSRFRDGTIAAITGGYDSRTILAALLYSGLKIPLVTHYEKKGIDFRIAQRVAEAAGFEHRCLHIGETYRSSIAEHARIMLKASNGMCDVYNAHAPFIYQHWSGKAALMLDGNHSSIEGRWYLRNSAHSLKGKDDFVEAVIRNLLAGNKLSLVREEHRARIRGASEEIAGERITAAYRGENGSDAADIYYAENLLPYHNSDLALLQNGAIRYASPYYDLDYVATLYKLPPRIRWMQGPQQAVIRRCFPDVVSHPRSYADIRTLAVSNQVLQRLPVAYQRLLDKTVKRRFEGLHRRMSIVDPTMPYENNLDLLTLLPEFRMDGFDDAKLEALIQKSRLENRVRPELTKLIHIFYQLEKTDG